MTPQQLAAALNAGIIEQAEHDTMVAQWNANQAERDNAEQANQE